MTLKVVKSLIVIMKGSKMNGLYMFNGLITIRKANVIDNSIDRSKLWHLRLGRI